MTPSTRRDFARGTAGALAGWTVFSPGRTGAAPADRINLAVMGLRGRGRGLALGFAGMPDARVSHLIDVDPRVLPPLVKAIDERQGGAPKLEGDVRRVLDDPMVDALVIATPDHWHALATVWACQAGKHVYVEKPASHDLREGRKMVDAARKYRRVVQVGTQSRSAPHYLDMIAALRAGRIGRVHQAKAWNSQRRPDLAPRPDSAVPEGVDYGLWQGPAPDRPFNENRFHYGWHWCWDYGTGDMGNDGVHDLDIARWGLDVRGPRTIAGVGTRYDHPNWETPDTQVIAFGFPEGEAILLYEQRDWSPYVQEGYENGVAFYGTEGYILAGRSGWRLFEKGNKEVPTPAKPFSDDPHRRNFLDCIKSGARPNADIEEGHLSSTLAHLGNIVGRVGRQLDFDPRAEAINGDDEAAALLGRSYRKGFEVPEAV